MKKIIIFLSCIICIVLSIAGCGNGTNDSINYVDEVQTLAEITPEEFFEKMPEVSSLIVGISEKEIDKTLWTKGVNNGHYHGQFEIAGYDGGISLIMKDEKVSSVEYKFNSISSEEYKTIAEAGKTVFGEPVVEKDNSISWSGVIVLFLEDSEVVSVTTY